MKISVIIPLYRCSNFIEELTNRLHQTLQKISFDYEIIYVNDASPENDWQIVCSEAKKNIKVKGINLSRNFGQHYAITAGLNCAQGEWIVVMDGDLQDMPEEINKLYSKTKEGFEIVCAQRIKRKDHYLKKLSSYLFYKIFSYLTDTKQDESIANFGIYHHKVIDSILSMNDNIRYFPTMIQWVGFNKTNIEVDHGQRSAGSSSYNLYRLTKLAFDNIISFSDKPLRLMVKLGISITILTFIVFVYMLVLYLKGKIEVIGYSSLILSIWFFSGIIIFFIGIVGIYLGKVFEKVKDRPLYIITDKINL
jgi:polyisoprenyl-phosphate glycosyltransferase